MTTLEKLDSIAYKGLTEFIQFSFASGAIGLISGVVLSRYPANIMLLGAGIGGGLAFGRCKLAFDMLSPKKPTRELDYWGEAILMMGRVLRNPDH